MRTTRWQLSRRRDHLLDRAIIGSFEHFGSFFMQIHILVKVTRAFASTDPERTLLRP